MKTFGSKLLQCWVHAENHVVLTQMQVNFWVLEYSAGQVVLIKLQLPSTIQLCQL